LYRGDLLPACYDEWLLPERERLRELFVDALAQLIARHEAAHEFSAAIRYARRLLQADPLGEEVYRKLMSLYAQIGDRANVVRVYQTCVGVVKREFDAEPSAATRELFERLRLEELPRERPPAPRAQPKPNLPVPLTSFVGRTRELGEIRALLERSRLVTLTGVGGGGKTRLAIQAAYETAAKFSGGAWFIDMAPLADGADVPFACATGLGLREQTGASINELLIEYARDKELLLVLDNCEHLRAACANLTQELLQAAPRLRVLATSREPLNLAGEALLVVPPLSLPAAGHPALQAVAHSDAAQLFRARAEFVLPTFALDQVNAADIAQICRRLEGIPLAIELAAARVRALTPRQIAARLDDSLEVLTRGSSNLPTRHQTMRAVLDWSDSLLATPERALFRRLSVFAGGFTLEAAEQICRDELLASGARAAAQAEPGAQPSFILHSSSLILDLLSNLIDKSLVTNVDAQSSEAARYRLLEPVRQYAREKLDAAGERAPTAARHLVFYMQMTEQAETELMGPQTGQWVRQLEIEHDNLREALSWNAHEPGQGEQQLRMAGALWRFWYVRGNIVEGRKYLTNALKENPSADAAARAKAYTGLGAMEWLRGDYEQAIRWHEQGLALYRQVGDTRGIALSLDNIGIALVYQAEYERAVSYLEESRALAREIGDRVLETAVLNGLAEVARYQGDLIRAQALNEEAGAAAAEIQYLQQIGVSRNNLGLLATRQGDFARAIQLHQEGIELYRTTKEIRLIPESLEGLAAAARGLGQPEKAAMLLGASDAIRASIQLPILAVDRDEYERVLERVREDLQEHFQSTWAKGRAMSMEQAIDFALEISG
jgi:non-specific serine/threonine protein kinase